MVALVDEDDGDEGELVPFEAVARSLDDHQEQAAHEAARSLFRRFGKPAAHDAERALLGGILKEPAALEAARAEGLQPLDFDRPAHRVIFEAMADARPAALLNVVDVLERRGHLNAVGGAAAVAKLQAAAHTSAHVGPYARLVRDKARLRHVIDIAETMAATALRQAGPLDGVVGEAEAQLGRLRSTVAPTNGFAAEVARARADLEREAGTTGQDVAGPLFESMSELMQADIPSTAWLVEGLLMEAAVAAVSGEPKTTKTWCALHLGIAIAAGRRAFGEFWVPHRRHVAAFLTEDGRRGVRNRVRAFCAAERVDAGDVASRMHVRAMKKLDLRRTEDGALLLASLRALPEMPALVILDPLRNLIGNANEDKAHEMAPVFEMLRALRTLTGATMLFVHHSTKANESSKGRRGGQKMRGSGAIHGAIDCGLYLDNLKGDATHRWLNTASVEVKDAEGAGTFGLELNVQDEDRAAVHAEFTFHRDPVAMYRSEGATPAAPTMKGKERALAMLKEEHDVAKRHGRAPHPISASAMAKRCGVGKSAAAAWLNQLYEAKPPLAFGTSTGGLYIDYEEDDDTED